MSEFQKRILSSIVFVILILGPLFFEAFVPFLVYGLLGTFTFLEYTRLYRNKDFSIGWIFGLLLYLLIGSAFLAPIIGFQLNLIPLLSLSLGLMLLAMVREVFKANYNPQHVATELFGALYCALSFWGMSYFFSYRSDFNTLWLPISIFVIIWINDSAAYLVGRKLGKTPLIPNVSPKKTIEGSLGGVVFAIITGFALSYLPDMPNHWMMAAISIICVIFGSIGDLFESIIKRKLGVKDSGKFLPGHGGFLDRFDAMMMAVPALIVFFELVIPKP